MPPHTDRGFAYTADVPERSIFPDLQSLPRHQFRKMLTRTPFLFRVHDELSHVTYSPADGFFAREYVGESSKSILSWLDKEVPVDFDAYEVQYGVKAHIRNFFKAQTPSTACPWISTTPQWTWAIAEAIKRKRSYEVKVQDIKVSVIDVRRLLQFETETIAWNKRSIFYGMELLHLTGQIDDSRAREWTNHPQEVLVFGTIPASAVISTVSLESLGVPTLGTRPIQTSSPLPPWFFRDFAVSNGIVWRARRDAGWYSGSEGARSMLIQNFKLWAEDTHKHNDRDTTRLFSEIVSSAFDLAEFLVMPEREFQLAIKLAVSEARGVALRAESDALLDRFEQITLMDRPYDKSAVVSQKEPAVVEAFPHEELMAAVNEMWERLIKMTEIIARWGIERLDDTLSERLQVQIHHHAQRYTHKLDELELEVRKSEVIYDHYTSAQKRLLGRLASSSKRRPEFVLW
ncbi:hypothetical protein C8R42DRAFT_687814 [Lentinula raphanica]|nr:hypothetical protein C8R42DRAFT_687814 [Lentinula raphanica]